MKRINYASYIRDIMADNALASGLGVRVAVVWGAAQRERINASLNTERNWT